MQYLLMIYTENDTPDPNEPEALAAQRMGRWRDYTQALQSAEVYLGGEALLPVSTAQTVRHAASGEHVVSDGPFAETKELLAGYYLIDVQDQAEAVSWAKRCPILDAPGGSCEVRALLDLSS